MKDQTVHSLNTAKGWIESALSEMESEVVHVKYPHKQRRAKLVDRLHRLHAELAECVTEGGEISLEPMPVQAKEQTAWEIAEALVGMVRSPSTGRES